MTKDEDLIQMIAYMPFYIFNFYSIVPLCASEPNSQKVIFCTHTYIFFLLVPKKQPNPLPHFELINIQKIQYNYST